MDTQKHANCNTTVVIGQPMIGPEPHGIRYCLRCMEPIEPGEHWHKISRGGGACAVGLHDRCLAQPWPCTGNEPPA